MTRSSMLGPLALVAVAVGAAWAADPPGLKDLAPPGLRVGVAVNRAQAAGEDPVALAIVGRHFDQVTPENDLKWERVHSEPGRYEFDPADRFVELGRSRGMFVVGHVLL